MACDRLADRCAAAAARHELTGHLPSAAHRWRKRGWSSTCNMVAAGRCWCLSAMDSSITDHLAQANSLDMLALVGEVRGQAGLHPHPHPPARGELPYVILRVGRRVPHLENGLLMIFRLVCGSSAPAPSCRDARLWQTSPAVLLLPCCLARAGSCATARLHSNPSTALTSALAKSFSRFLTTPAPILAHPVELRAHQALHGARRPSGVRTALPPPSQTRRQRAPGERGPALPPGTPPRAEGSSRAGQAPPSRASYSHFTNSVQPGNLTQGSLHLREVST